MQIILASNSPRRQQLLRDAGIDFLIRVKEVEESYPADYPVQLIGEYLSQKKAKAYLPELQPAQLLITADTTVVLDDRLLEKAADEAEAKRMLQALSGRTHEVITGVSLTAIHKQVTFQSLTTVEFHPLSEADIDYYIQHYRPFDKAGAYGIQEWIGMVGVKRIEGSYYNVMGLPIDRIVAELRKF